MTTGSPPAGPGATATLGEMIGFWRQGGLRLVRPLARGEAAPAALTILLQPDGDVVLGLPRDFGTDAGDHDAGLALIGEAGAAMRRIAGTGYGDVARAAARTLDLALGGTIVATCGLAAAMQAALWAGATSAGLIGGRWLARKALLPWLGQVALRKVRRAVRSG